MDYSEYEKLVNDVFSTELGTILLKELEKKFVYTAIVQTDGEIPSAIRAGKSDLIRQFNGIINRIKQEQE